MKVRRYFASSMREALEAVRRDQGSDALILSNRNVEGGIELMIAIGEGGQTVSTDMPPLRTGEDSAEKVFQSGRQNTTAGSTALWTHPDTVTQMQRELGAIKGLIEQQLSSFAWHDFRGRHPLHARLMDDLTAIGFAPHLGRKLVETIDNVREYDAAWQQLLTALQLRLRAIDDPLCHGGRAAFCGATGVGKTTLVSKLAARYALRHGTESVALISADEQRLGAHHQLKTFGRLLGIQVEAARDQATLRTCLDSLQDKSLVLIDLPGYAPQDAQFSQIALDSSQLGTPVDLYLVAAATTEYLALNRVVKALSGLPIAGCCLTKLDEAAAVGAALSMLYESRLPLAYISQGQQVPDDALQISLQGLIQRAETLSAQHPVPSMRSGVERVLSL